MKQDENSTDYSGGNPNLRNIWGPKFTIIALVIVVFFTGLLIYRVVTSPGENIFQEPDKTIQQTK